MWLISLPFHCKGKTTEIEYHHNDINDHFDMLFFLTTGLLYSAQEDIFCSLKQFFFFFLKPSNYVQIRYARPTCNYSKKPLGN